MTETSTYKFIYTGIFALTFDSKILQIVRTMAQQYNLDKAFERNLTFLVTEFTQNIVKHQEVMQDTNFKPGLSLYFDGGTYQMFSSNTIEKQDLTKLEEKIDTINSKTKEELIEYYKQELAENTFSEKSGAGLGLIEFARRTGNPIAFKSKKISEQIYIIFIGCKFTINENEAHDFFPEFMEYYLQLAQKENTVEIHSLFNRLFGNSFLSMLPMLITGLSTQSQSWQYLVMVFKLLLEYCGTNSQIKINLQTDKNQSKLMQDIFIQSEHIDTLYAKLEDIKNKLKKSMHSESNNLLTEIIFKKGQTMQGKTNLEIALVF